MPKRRLFFQSKIRAVRKRESTRIAHERVCRLVSDDIHKLLRQHEGPLYFDPSPRGIPKIVKDFTEEDREAINTTSLERSVLARRR